MSESNRLRRAFTLIELLVVIAIIGTLVALLLPAVQSARESSRRVQCSNNFKQLGIGLTQYADTYRGAFPVGAYTCCMGTWQVALLPYIEQKALFDEYKGYGMINASGEIDQTFRYAGAENRDVTNKTIKVYTCPSDNKVAPRGAAMTTFHNYVGNYGNTTVARKATHGVQTNGQPNKYGKAPFIYVANSNQSPQVMRLQDVIDGLSSTMAFSETLKGQYSDLRGFGWWRGGSHFETYLAPNTSQPDVVEQAQFCNTQHPNPPCVGATTANPETIAARSRHPGGVGVVMCDGSYKFITDGVNLDTWRFLSTASGREPANNLNL
jgi:prepilin-type N-terminal cleavage/methylation domain-containing protein